MVSFPWLPQRKTVSNFLLRLARLGGNLARTRDTPPGNSFLKRLFLLWFNHGPSGRDLFE